MQKNPDIDMFSSSEELLHGGGHNRRKAVVIILVIAAVVIAASAFLIFFYGHKTVPEWNSKDYAVVYTKNDGTFLKSSAGECKLDIEKPNEMVETKDGKKLFYLSKSSYGSGKLDLHCCFLNDSSQIAKGGFIVDFGIEDSFYTNADGSYVIYSKMNDDGSAVMSYLYNTDNKKATEITSSVVDVFVFSKDNTAYFTKKLGTSTALFKYTFGGNSEKIAVDVKNVMQFTSQTICELLYEVVDVRTETSGLFIISGNTAPQLVSDGVSKVLSDKYTAGGNLYYLKKSENITMWQDIIPDDLKDQDDVMTEPQKSDYVSFFGISFDYNKALNEYQDKLNRDELRASIDKLVTEEKLIPEQFDCFAFKNGTVSKIAEGVSGESISAVSQVGDPMVIYDKSIYLPSDTKFSNLTEIMKNSNQQDAVKFAQQAIKKAAVSKGFYISYSNNVQGVSLNTDDDETKDCVFSFSSSGGVIYSLVKDSQGVKSTLYACSLVNGNLSQRQVVDVNITSFCLFGDSALYLQLDAGKSEGSLYAYSNGKSQKIMSNVHSYFCLNDNSILILCNDKEGTNEPSADLYYYQDGKSGLIDENVALLHIRYQTLKSLAYIRNFTSKNGGELCVIKNSENKAIDNGVKEILIY